MKVVSNTGPLSTLGKLRRLDLLIKLSGQISIPVEVQEEIQVGVQRGFLHSRTLQAMIENRQMRVVEAFASELVFGRPIDKRRYLK